MRNILKKRPKDDGSWPIELRFNEKDARLYLKYDDGFKGDIPFELLRVLSPSAETRGHGGQTPPPPTGKRHVLAIGADPVGRYAIRIRFNDGHDTGLYSWPFLRDLAENKKRHMTDYTKRLEDAGLNRD